MDEKNIWKQIPESSKEHNLNFLHTGKYLQAFTLHLQQSTQHLHCIRRYTPSRVIWRAREDVYRSVHVIRKGLEHPQSLDLMEVLEPTSPSDTKGWLCVTWASWTLHGLYLLLLVGTDGIFLELHIKSRENHTEPLRSQGAEIQPGPKAPFLALQTTVGMSE